MSESVGESTSEEVADGRAAVKLLVGGLDQANLTPEPPKGEGAECARLGPLQRLSLRGADKTTTLGRVRLP